MKDLKTLETDTPVPLGPAPKAEIRPTTTTVWDTEVADEFSWLKAENWKAVLKDASALPDEIGSYLKAENLYSETAFAPDRALRETLVAEMRGRIKEDDSSVPTPHGPYGYVTRFREGGQHPAICRQPREGGPDETLLDGDEEAKGHPYFQLAEAEPSPDHRLLAWSMDVTGAEFHTIRVRDLASGRDADDIVPTTTGDVVWSRDSASFYYIELDDNHRPVRVKHHRLGADPTTDAVVYEEPDPGWFVSIGSTTSQRFLTITPNAHEASEVHLVDLASPGAPILVAPRAPRVLYDVEHHGERLIIRTNQDGAEDFKLVETPLDRPSPEHWRDLVPHRPGIMILSYSVFARHLVRLERQDANPRIVVRDLATGDEHPVAFDDEAFSLGFEEGREFDTTTLRFTYSSLRTPRETWDYDLATRARTLRKRQMVPSGHDVAHYATRRLFATAPDGETVPVSIVHRADLVRDGSAPCLLYGYGAYGMSMPASFRTNILSLVDRGFVFAIAHVRGGTEKGWHWYLDGKREHKANSFSDFLACADALVEAGLTGRGRIVAQGGSAGGLLMGAVANQSEGRFAGIVAEVPFVDVLNTMLDGELPLTPPEWPEWGDPASDEAAFRTILSYSPYDNVAAQAYPAILALGGLTDPRVTYWEPAKWVARLRHRMAGGGPVFLKINMEAGHGGASGRFDHLDEVALAYGFALRAVGGGWAAPSAGTG